MRVAVVTESGGAELSAPAVLEAVETVGRNTGNLAFQQVISRHVEGEVSQVRWDECPALVRDRFDCLAIPEASVLVEGRDFGWKAAFIEAVDLPLISVGIGFQDPRRDADPMISEGTRRYLEALSSRTAVLGVRGPRSARIVQRCGIGNVAVTGCPSLFWSSTPYLGRTIEASLAEIDGVLRPAVTVGPDKRALRRVHERLAVWIREAGGTWIAQSGDGLVAALRGDPYQPSHSVLGRIRNHRRRGGSSLEPSPTQLSGCDIWKASM